MPTCPNCGEIVMNGDPYCPHCGATLRWINDEEDEDNNTAYFLQDFRIAKRNYDEGDYSKSFMFLLSASTCYKSLSRQEKRQLGEDPMKEDWAIDVICRAFNSHDTRKMDNVLEMLRDHKLIVSLCDDCTMIYPPDAVYCKGCGELVEKPSRYSNPATIREVLDKDLRRNLLDSYRRTLVISRTLDIMKENGAILEEIRDEYSDGLILVYKKRHKYFDTYYEYLFDPELARPDRVFYDCECYSNHERLLQNSSFKSMIKKTEQKTGYTFIDCVGGYESLNYNTRSEELKFTNRLDLKARFRTDDGRTALYDVDPDRMELGDEMICS